MRGTTKWVSGATGTRIRAWKVNSAERIAAGSSSAGIDEENHFSAVGLCAVVIWQLPAFDLATWRLDPSLEGPSPKQQVHPTFLLAGHVRAETAFWAIGWTWICGHAHVTAARLI